ncbi:MAG: crtD, partial [Labilithrix sp.]|nr:crtD [Labilithrix sp.]
QGPGGALEGLAASAVVANTDIATLASGALGPVAARACGRPTPAARRSLSALTWAIVARTGGLPLDYHNVFFGADYPAEHRQLFDERRLPSDPTVYVCAQDRAAQGAAPPGDERLFVIVNAPATGDGAPLAPDEVERCEAAMFSRLSRAGLSLSVVEVARATPSTFEAMAPGTGGAIYGEASHGAFSALSRPGCRTRLPGLLLASGSVHPGPGVPMAALSGRTAAGAVREYLGSTSPSRTAVTAGSISTA